jgi:hypothetical protein
MSTVIGQVECTACGERANVNEAKAGALTIHCKGPNGCGSQTFVKSPRAVERLRAKLAGRSPESKPEEAKGDPPKKPAGVFPGL